MSHLQGRRALVTGGARGIGRAITEKFIAEGAQVVIADINEQEAAETAEQLGDAVHSVACDVTSAEQITAAVAATTSKFGGLDILVNNAGIELVGPLLETDDDDFRKLTDIDLTGVFLGMKYALPALLETRGNIVNMASVAGTGGTPLLGAYAASKAGVIQLTRVAGVELRDHGIRVNAVCPGFVDTSMIERSGGAIGALLGTSFSDVVAAKQSRLGTAEEVADVVAFLASDRARWTTGAHYILDGGLSASLL